MTIEPYITNDIHIQPSEKKIGALQELFNELPHSHVPVEKNGEFIGSISENDARCFDSEKTIDDYRYALETFAIGERDPWLGILEVFAQNRTTLMPVLSEDNRYLGYVELNDIIGLFNVIPFLNEPGGILVIEKGFVDYSFSEICQIVESNGGKILGLFISRIQNDLVQVTIKTNANAMNEIIQSFRRYGYNIKSNHSEDNYEQNLKERSKYLKKYLEL